MFEIKIQFIKCMVTCDYHSIQIHGNFKATVTVTRIIHNLSLCLDCQQANFFMGNVGSILSNPSCLLRFSVM